MGYVARIMTWEVPLARLALPLLLVLVVLGCCPPYCGPASASQMNADLIAGEFEAAAGKASAVIQEGPEQDAYAEAFLFRAVAELALDGDLEQAAGDLAEAERLVDRLTQIDPRAEQGLLLRAQMVLNLQLDQRDAAERYREMALRLAPDQASLIDREFQEARLLEIGVTIGDE